MGDFLFTSDLHGDVSLYAELLDLADSSEASGLILGGDLLPSFPPDRSYEAIIPYQETFIDHVLLPYFKKMREVTAVRQIFLIPGNWDLAYPYLFHRQGEGLIDVSRQKAVLSAGYEMIGYPIVPPTPFRPKDYEKMDDLESAWPPQKNPSYIRSEEESGPLIRIDPMIYLRGRGTIREDLMRLRPVKNPERTIFVMHSPPFGTALDRIHGGGGAGSRSIQTFIEETQPLLTLHGHIHEAPELSGSFSQRIGKTLCINPGQFTRTGRKGKNLHAVLFQLEAPGRTARHTLSFEV
jgi:Icc-related predicted phosphoesterase